MKRITLILLLIVSTTCSNAKVCILQGTIGKFSIVMKIDSDDNSYYGAYFYASSKMDIDLTGVKTGGVYFLVHLKEDERTGKSDTTEKITLRKNSDKTWTGLWKNNKNKQFAITLKEVNLDTVRHPYSDLPSIKKMKKEDPLGYVRTSLLTTILDSTKVKEKYQFDYYHVSNTPISSFLVAGGMDKIASDKTNKLLLDCLIWNANAYYTCMPSRFGAYYFSIDTMFLTDHVISVTYDVGEDCGGPHPNSYNFSINVNAQTGEEYKLEDVLYLTHAKIPKENSDEWINFRSHDYAPKLLHLMDSMHHKYMIVDTSTDQECDYSSSDRWDFVDWHFTPEGLYISPSFPHVDASCENPKWSYIPYDVLKKYKNPAKNISLP